MRIRRHKTGAIGLASPAIALAVALVCSAPAQAGFTPPTLASGDPARELQADYAYDPAISVNGNYVAFTGSVASKPGIYRKNLATQQLELVARGVDTGAPSISADGRYISFTTDEDPVTGKSPGAGACSNVYVRDMNEEENKPAAFALVSARGESSESLTYQAPTPGQPCGAAAAARVALSADGRRVAFTTLSPSDLTGACAPTGQPPATTCPTPPDQVAVRDLNPPGSPTPGSTTLLSATRASLGSAPAPVPGGAALAGPTSSGSVSLAGGGRAELAVGASTAAISADGSTVAWMGVNVGEQSEVTGPLPNGGHAGGYAEPLWRRLADGPAAPVRRVLAGGDPSAPGCPPACAGGLDLEWDTQGISPQEYSGAAPEYGSYTSLAAVGFAAGAGFLDPLGAVTPQLSADGRTVALLSTQPNYGNDPNFGLFDQTKPPPANAFVVNMTPGLTRAQAIERLTDWASLDFINTALAAPVTSIALSPDGTRVAFTTQRVAFPLAPPALITPPLSQASATQLYEANLPAGTLQLVTQGYDGQPANGGVYAAALSEDGRTLALATGATNLVYGVVDQGSDVFTTSEEDSPAVAGRQSVSAPSPGPSAEVPWSISATATPSPDGTLSIYASVPGAGSLSANAVAGVAESPAAGRHRSRRATPRGRGRGATAARRKGASGRSHRRLSVAGTRRVAHAAARTYGPGIVELRLVPAARYRSLLRAKGGLYATITVTFTSPGQRRLAQSFGATFPRPSPIYKLPLYKLPRPPHKHHRHRRRKHR
jgi:WD40-like Beta Propeller Repeat